jgi:hypothetical protein
MKTITRLFVNLLILLLILWLPLKGVTAVYAQTAQPPPQKVIATGQYTNSGCPDSPLDIRLEVWNIGSAGGSQYNTATMTVTGYSCVNGKTSGGLGTSYLDGTFSGGPDGNGIVTLEGSALDQQSIQFPFHFVGGKSVKFQTFTLKVENPEAFFSITSQAPEGSSTPAPETTGEVISTPTPETTGEVTSTPTQESTGEIISTPPLVPTEAVGSIPTQVPVNDCLKDPLNAAGCMSTPFVRQGVVALVGVGATLVTILVVTLGGAATAAGEATTGTVAGVAVDAETEVGGVPAGAVTSAVTGQVPTPEQGNSASGTMTQAEYRQLKAQLEDLKTLAHTLARDELEWHTEWRRLFDLHERGITNYQSNASKLIFNFGKNVLDWTPISPTGPGQVINLAVEKFSGTVTDIITTPPPNKATDAQILEHMRKINKALEGKMEEAKKMTYQAHNDLENVMDEIDRVNIRLEDNPILLP